MGLDLTGLDGNIDRLNKETIPLLQNAVDDAINRIKAAAAEAVDRAVSQVSNVVQGSLVGVQGIEDKTLTDIANLIDGFDGWNLNISVNVVLSKLPTITVKNNIAGISDVGIISEKGKVTGVK